MSNTTTSRPTNNEPTTKRRPSAGGSFNLRALIREAMATAPYANPGQLAAEVAERIPENKVREALDQALRFFVRQVMSEERPHGPIAQPSRVPASVTRPSGGSGAVPLPTFTPPQPDNTPVPQNVGGPQAKYTGSRKGAEIRDGWQKVLDAKYSTPDGWKSLGDCTYDDLQGMAAYLDKQADQKKARARGWRELAALMTEHEAQILRDLPAEVLMNALGGK